MDCCIAPGQRYRQPTVINPRSTKHHPHFQQPTQHNVRLHARPSSGEGRLDSGWMTSTAQSRPSQSTLQVHLKHLQVLYRLYGKTLWVQMRNACWYPLCVWFHVYGPAMAATTVTTTPETSPAASVVTWNKEPSALYAYPCNMYTRIHI